MRTGDRAAAGHVDLGYARFPQRDCSVDEVATVHVHALDGGLDVGDLDARAAVEQDDALVGELAAGLGVERRAVEDDLDLGRRDGERCAHAVDEHAQNRGAGGRLGVAEELDRRWERGPQRLVGCVVGVAGLLRDRVGAGASALLGHERAECGLVDLDALLGRHLEGQVDRESVRVVQSEGLSAAERGCRALGCGVLGLADRGVEDRCPGSEGAKERILFAVGNLGDAIEVCGDVGVGGTHRVARDREEFWKRGLLNSEKAQRTNGAAHDAAQNVAAALVRGGDPVTDEHERGAHVVGDDTHTHVVLAVGPVPATRQLLGRGDERVDLIDLVHVRFALKEDREALEARAGIDRLLVEFADERVVLALALAAQELIEHEVPDLEVAVPAWVDRAADRVRAICGATVIVKLGARAGRPRLAGVPEVLGPGQSHEVRGIDTDLLRQDVIGLGVLVPHRDPHLVAVEPVAAVVLRSREQLPGVVDRALFEVVPEREVAVHLEERAVARRASDVLNVVRADALLHTRGAGPRGRLGSNDVRDERDHAGDGEQQRRVRGDQRRAGHDLVVVIGEVLDPAITDLGGAHDVLGLLSGWCVGAVLVTAGRCWASCRACLGTSVGPVKTKGADGLCGIGALDRCLEGVGQGVLVLVNARVAAGELAIRGRGLRP